MKVRLPHQLNRSEVRRRLDAGKDEIISYFPDGMASLDSSWRDEDHFDIVINAMGQKATGSVEIADDHVVVSLELPGMLSLLSGKIKSKVKKEGTRLLT